MGEYEYVIDKRTKTLNVESLGSYHASCNSSFKAEPDSEEGILHTSL